MRLGLLGMPLTIYRSSNVSKKSFHTNASEAGLLRTRDH